MENSKKQKQQNQRSQPAPQPAEPEITKLDYAVAKYLRNNLPEKEAMFVGIKRVNYFIGSKAVDLLMASECFESNFKTRNSCVMFLNSLLLKKFYHRAKKIIKMDRNKRKFKLDMHDVQVFEDSNQPYVWLYEPTSLKAWLCCIGLVVAVILICLFPLWPSSVRTGVWYICICALIFLSSVLFLACLRHVVFFALWTLTFGKLHFWILPNLTEDVGFFESFWPLYTVEKGEDVAAAAAALAAGGTSNGGTNNSSGASNGGSNSGEASGTSHSHQD